MPFRHGRRGIFAGLKRGMAPVVDLSEPFDVVVVGGGNAALCAAITAARSGAA